VLEEHCVQAIDDRVGHVDDDVDSFQRLSQTAPGDQVDTMRASNLDHRDIAAF
jgi:hypothetical protein